MAPRRICFVTGTRAEFGLMRSVLQAIQATRGLQLQIIATGMHLDRSRGSTLKQIASEGFKVDVIAPWNSRISLSEATGRAMADIAAALERLQTDIVLVVGDRVEAFAGAAAGAISGKVVAHIHGGDRALGQVDDSLRHAITKLAHIHFPATVESAARIARLGEDKWRIHRVGSPGLDGIVEAAAKPEIIAGICPTPFGLLALHPADSDDRLEQRRAQLILNATIQAGISRVVIIHPNNDPGSAGIVAAWHRAANNPRCIVKTNVPRAIFLGLLRDAAVLVGNSSAGIIEAASFHTPVVDIGPRQMGRERSADVRHVPYDRAAIEASIRKIWNNARPLRGKSTNPYSTRKSSAAKIAAILGRTPLDGRLRRKLIAY